MDRPLSPDSFLRSMFQKCSGDIAVSENTVHKFLNTSNNFNSELWKAYSNTENLWNQNIVNGEYIIAYQFSSSLDQKLIDMLPKVPFRFASISVANIFNLGDGKNRGSHLHQV